MSFLGVYLPSDARAPLENLQASRARSGPSRTIGREVAARRRPDDPYDPECIKRLKVLAMTLGRAAPDLADPHVGSGERDYTSFVEAYFTNYIEGTRFLGDKARRIVFEHEPADRRPQDGRDVAQTFAQVASIVPGEARASSADEFMAEIRERNERLLDARPDEKPGEFKEDANSADKTVFVLPDLVKGPCARVSPCCATCRPPSPAACSPIPSSSLSIPSTMATVGPPAS